MFIHSLQENDNFAVERYLSQQSTETDECVAIVSPNKAAISGDINILTAHVRVWRFFNKKNQLECDCFDLSQGSYQVRRKTIYVVELTASFLLISHFRFFNSLHILKNSPSQRPS